MSKPKMTIFVRNSGKKPIVVQKAPRITNHPRLHQQAAPSMRARLISPVLQMVQRQNAALSATDVAQEVHPRNAIIGFRHHRRDRRGPASQAHAAIAGRWASSRVLVKPPVAFVFDPDLGDFGRNGGAKSPCYHLGLNLQHGIASLVAFTGNRLQLG